MTLAAALLLCLVYTAAPALATPPNIVVILTDDQDVMLGASDPDILPETYRLLADEGATFSNAFVNTPICCPSRATFYSGRYQHNHLTIANNVNCFHGTWVQQLQDKTFATVLKKHGYRTGHFGKYLNRYSLKNAGGQRCRHNAPELHVPGWDDWKSLIGNSVFYNYTLFANGRCQQYNDRYPNDYLTNVIKEFGKEFISFSKNSRPFALVLSVPAPHGPEDSAPQHSTWFANHSSHRTFSWNRAPNPDKHDTLQTLGKLPDMQLKFTDVLHRKRLMTLQSVDNLVKEIVAALETSGALENTYIIFTSDHGYHLGQFGLVKGKNLPYEFDIRVPLFVRGPGVVRGSRVEEVALMVDIAPTIIDLAGAAVPADMDGESLKRLLLRGDAAADADAPGAAPQSASPPPFWPLYFRTGTPMIPTDDWRDAFLVEKGKRTTKQTVQETIFLESHLNGLPLEARLERAMINCADRPEQRYIRCHNDSARPFVAVLGASALISF